MPGLLEDHFPPEKVEAVYAAILATDLAYSGVEPDRRAVVGAFCAELRRHGFVVTAFPASLEAPEQPS